MNYRRIYETLITRSKNRMISGYVEIHHILPRCMGGSDDADNLATLTAREHYLAHQLLVKMYPKEHGLVKAASMMCVGHDRMNNRLYEWLRIKLSLVMSESQTGSGNSQFGTMWVVNHKLQEIKKIRKEDFPLYETLGFMAGRSLNVNNCKTCGVIISKGFTYCDNHRETGKRATLDAKSIFLGREDEFYAAYDKCGSMNKALKEMGFPGAISHWYKWEKTLLDNRK